MCKYILGYDLMTEQTHGELCAYTQSILPISTEEKELILAKAGKKVSKIDIDGTEIHDEYDPSKKMLLLMMPRNTFKSSVVTIGFSLQFILHDPNVRILIDSETFSKAKAFLAEIKGHLEDNEKYRDVFYTLYGKYPDDDKKNTSVRWTDSMIDISARTKKRKEPTFSCAGIDVTKNGMHYDLIVCDDLHSERNVTNNEQIQQVIDHWKLGLSLLEPNKYMIVIGTRWDYKDMYQYLLDFEKDRFNIMIRQAILPDGSLFFPEVLDQNFLNEQKRSQGSYIYSCNPAGSKILMADWSQKNIEDIKPGDEVVGWNLGSRHNKSRLKPSKVQFIGNRVAPVVKVTLASGKIFRCTPDHHWYLNPKGVGKSKYLPVKVGRQMMTLPIEEENRYDAWLAGIFDGEGSCSKDYKTIKIAQSRSYNPKICAEIEQRLNEYGFKWGYNGDAYWINGGLSERARFLQITRPVRSDKILDSLWVPDFIKVKDTVISIEPDGEEVVYSMQTETGNYVCHNILSRNCQYMNDPVDNETATFKRSYFQYKKWEDITGKPINWYLSIDPSFEGPYSDYVAMVEGGMDYQGELYVGDTYRLKLTYSQIIQLMFDLYSRKQYKSISLETIAGQKSLMYMLNEEQRRRQVWLPVKEINSRTKQKEERIRGLAPYYEFKRVWHIQDGKQIEELEDELLHFPKGKHDDCIDALSTVLEIATVPRAHTSEDRREKTKKIIKLMNKPRSPLTGI